MLDKKCIFCDRDASNRFVVNGSSSHVCDKCIKGRSTIDRIHGVFSRLEPEEDFLIDDGSTYPEKCSNCGTSLHVMVQTMRCGCPQCYVVYGNIYDEIDKATSCVESNPDEMTGLKIQLEQAIREERYEDANDIKKMMESMK